jgi:hypothetical protein
MEKKWGIINRVIYPGDFSVEIEGKIGSGSNTCHPKKALISEKRKDASGCGEKTKI